MITILGCGPSGLMSAWACLNLGKEFRILSKLNILKPKVSGFTYLASKCNLPISKAILTQIFLGDEVYDIESLSSLYNIKVYDKSKISNSFIRQYKNSPEVEIWNLNEAIDLIWNIVYDKIEIIDSISSKEKLLEISKENDLVISTIPLSIFVSSCKYSLSKIDSIKFESDNFCIYNSMSNTKWYRAGSIFGSGFIEYFSNEGDIKKVISVDKFVFEEFPKNIIFAGRYGEWNKEVRIDDVYNKIIRVINERNI